MLSDHNDIELHLLIPSHGTEASRSFNHNESLGKEKNTRLIIAETYLSNHMFLRFYKKLSHYIKEIAPDIIHLDEEPWSTTAFQTKRIVKKLKMNCKIIFVTWENIYYEWRLPDLRYFLHRQFQSFTLRHADAAIARNREAVDVIRKRGYKNPVTYIPDCVDTDTFIPKTRNNYNGMFTVGYIGRLTEQKGLLTLLQAIRLIGDNVQCIIIGDGHLRDWISSYSRKYGMEKRIKLLGAVPHTDLVHYYNNIDLLVLPSLTTRFWKEQFGRVLVEAMSCETPVLGSSSGAIPYVIHDDRLIFKEGDHIDLIRKIKYLMNDAKAFVNHAKTGRKRVLHEYTITKFTESTIRLFDEVFNLR